MELTMKSFLKSIVLSVVLAFSESALSQSSVSLKNLVETAPVEEESPDKAKNGMPFCTELKVFKEKCALSSKQILHMIKSRTISGTQVGYNTTTFVFGEDGTLVTNGRTGGKWEINNNLISLENHWSVNPSRHIVSYESLHEFGLANLKQTWFSWK